MRQILITVAGRNGSGKSLIAKKVAEALGLNVVKSYATRKPRPEELQKGLENCDHIFVSDEEYDKLENITAETEINGARYCTTQEILNNSDIYVIDPKGIKDLKERCGNRYKLLQFYIYADADKRAARFVARGESKAKFEAREQSEDEQFNDYENSHGWDIIIYNNWDIDTAVKTMLGYVRPIMTPVIEARQKQADEEFEKMMNPPAEEKVEDAPADKQADEQAGMKEQQSEEPENVNEQAEAAPVDEEPDNETGDEDSQTKESEAESEHVENVSDDAGKQMNEPDEEKSETKESPAEEQQAESEIPEEDDEELEECQQEGASDDSSKSSASTEANNDPFSLDFDDEDKDFMNMPAGVDAESDESDDADVDNTDDSANESNSDAADQFSLDDFDDPDEEDTDSSDEPEKPEEYEEPDDVPEKETKPVEEPVDESTSEPAENPAEENTDNSSKGLEESEESSDDEEDDDGEAILID